jgi:hypothetical protein
MRKVGRSGEIDTESSAHATLFSARVAQHDVILALTQVASGAAAGSELSYAHDEK